MRTWFSGSFSSSSNAGIGSPSIFGCFTQREALVGHPVDAAMLVIAVRIAEVVLHVPDDRVLPVEEVDRPVRARRSPPVGRKFGSLDETRSSSESPRSPEPSVGHLHAIDPLEADHVAVQEVPLYSRGNARLVISPVPGHGREGRFQNSFIAGCFAG